MPYLQIGDARFPLRNGANPIGRAGTSIRVLGAEAGADSVLATLTLSAAGASIAPLTGANLALNGVPVGEPVPVLHGDRIEVGGSEFRFADETHLGDTIALPIEPDAPIAVPGPTAATSRTGGRLVSQTDGREYPVGDEALVLGRDAGCDVVVARPDVSRRHLTIRREGRGYLLLDTSANGVFVNGARVMTEVPIGRGDTIRVGLEEFRFHAEEGAAAVQEAVAQLAMTGTFAAARRPGPAEPPPAVKGAVRVDDRAILATLQITNEGPTKGQLFEIRSPRTDIGRGAHNDIVIADESVSDSHAKLQRREDGWYLADQGSTNGTYYAGTRVSGDARVAPGGSLRFGGVKMVFRPEGGMARPSGETRVIVGVKGPDPKRESDRQPERVDQALSGASAKRGWAFGPVWWLVILALTALIIWTVNGAGEA